jgi:diguanylate cyclase (GGDEF)-like protein
MRNLSQRATAALVGICLFFAVIVVGVGVTGVIGVRAATHTGKSVTDDELDTSTATAQVGRSMDMAYAAGEEALLTVSPEQRSTLAADLYSQLVPTADRQLADLRRLHAADPPGELADVNLFAAQWTTVRGRLNPTLITASNDRAVLAGRLTAAYEPLGDHVDRLLLKERHDATDDEAQAAAQSSVSVWIILAAVAAGLVTAFLLGWLGPRRVRRAVEPEQGQIEFADTLQIAGDEEEAHLLLQRHLERTLADSAAVVFNRNNSADRLEAVTPFPEGSPLLSSLRGAEPRSCLAVRSGRTHRENDQHRGLLACSVCSVCPGSSTCVPLTVGGEVIGSVLLSRAVAYNEVEQQRISESVSQAAPVLANLRNLAVSELRAATDGLTGLPNKRAVTDTLKRMFAQASRTSSSLTIVLLDLDHFKQINDRLGHPIGDQVLANVGAVLRSALRPGDFAGRNGGEEFALFLPDTDAAGGYEIAERVRTAIADISLPGVEVPVTASLGVACYPDHAGTPERLERLADAALYVAKRSGRNRTDLADPNRVSAELATTNGHNPKVQAL